MGDIKDSNILEIMSNLVDKYTLDMGTKLLTEFMLIIGPMVTFYMLIILLKAAVEQRDVKEPLKTLVRFFVLYSLVTTNYHFRWAIEPIASLKYDLLIFFVGDENGLWGSTVAAIEEGKKIMNSNSGWFGDFAASLFGGGLMLVYGLCFALYSAIYIINEFIFNMAILFSGILLLLASKTIFTGLIKAWFQLLLSATLNIILITIVMIISVQASQDFLANVSASKAGATYFAAFLIPVVTLYVMPHVGSFTSTVVGGGATDFGSELGNTIQMARLAMKGGKKAAGGAQSGGMAIGGAIAKQLAKK
ncbi:hypothetical protein ACPFTR_003236 [Vibrio cholerae]